MNSSPTAAVAPPKTSALAIAKGAKTAQAKAKAVKKPPVSKLVRDALARIAESIEATGWTRQRNLNHHASAQRRRDYTHYAMDALRDDLGRSEADVLDLLRRVVARG